VAAVAVNVAVVAPEATITDDGTVSRALLLASATVDPPAGAAALIEAVQVEEPPPVSVFGLQVSAERPGTVITPPLAVIEATADPSGFTPVTFVKPIFIVPEFDASEA
jgi:hypothetical protein